VRDESLAHIKEVTEMFVSSLARRPTHVNNAEAQTSPDLNQTPAAAAAALDPDPEPDALADKENNRATVGVDVVPSSMGRKRPDAGADGGGGGGRRTSASSRVDAVAAGITAGDPSAYSSGFESGSGSGGGGGGGGGGGDNGSSDGSGSVEEEEGIAAAADSPGSRLSIGLRSSGGGSIPDNAPATGSTIRSRKSLREGQDENIEDIDDDIDEDDLAAAAVSGAFGSPTYPAEGGDTSSILDQVKGLVQTMSRHSSSIDEELGDMQASWLGPGARAKRSTVATSTVAGVEAAAAAVIDTTTFDDQVAAAFLLAVERQMSMEERVLKTQLAKVDDDVRHAAAAMHAPRASAADRSTARLQHAEAEACRAVLAQKIAANRAVCVQQKLISLRMAASRGAGVASLPAGVPLSGAAIAAFDAAAEDIIARSKSDRAATAHADAAAHAAGGGGESAFPLDDDDNDDDGSIEEEWFAGAAADRSEAGRSTAASIVEDSMAYTDDFEAASHANTRLLSDDVVEEGGLPPRAAAAAAGQPTRATKEGNQLAAFSVPSAETDFAANQNPLERRQRQQPNASFDDDSFDDTYKTVTAAHDEVQQRLRQRQRELRTAELASKQARIHEMERELAALEAAAVAVVSGAGSSGGMSFEDGRQLRDSQAISAGGGSPGAAGRGTSRSSKWRRGSQVGAPRGGEASESIEDVAVYSEEFASDESIEEEVPGVWGGDGRDSSIAEEGEFASGGRSSAARKLSAAAVASDRPADAGSAPPSQSEAAAAAAAAATPLSDYDAEAKLAAHEARIAQLEELVERKRLEAMALRGIKAREVALHRELHTLDASINRIESQPMPSPPAPSALAAVSGTQGEASAAAPPSQPAAASPAAGRRSSPATVVAGQAASSSTTPPPPVARRRGGASPPPQPTSPSPEAGEDTIGEEDAIGEEVGSLVESSVGYSADFPEDEAPSPSEVEASSGGISEEIDRSNTFSAGSGSADDSHVSVQYSVKSATVRAGPAFAVASTRGVDGDGDGADSVGAGAGAGAGSGVDHSQSFGSSAGGAGAPSRPRSPVATAAAALLVKDEGRKFDKDRRVDRGGDGGSGVGGGGGEGGGSFSLVSGRQLDAPQPISSGGGDASQGSGGASFSISGSISGSISADVVTLGLSQSVDADDSRSSSIAGSGGSTKAGAGVGAEVEAGAVGAAVTSAESKSLTSPRPQSPGAAMTATHEAPKQPPPPPAVGLVPGNSPPPVRITSASFQIEESIEIEIDSEVEDEIEFEAKDDFDQSRGVQSPNPEP
jgi:hypothetical protein